MPSEYQIQGRTQYSWTSNEALENLKLNVNVPKPADIPDGHVLVRIKAAALNARDMMVVSHDPVYPGPHVQNLVPCADGAGEIEAIGKNSKYQPGDRVVITANNFSDWDYHGDADLPAPHEMTAKGAGDVQGTLREYAVLPDDHVIKVSDALTFEELASLPAAGATAMHALFFGPKPLKPGQTVLAQGTGGVSCFVIQLAAAAGATVIATSSSDDKLEVAKKLGAKHTINYRTHPDWAEEVLKVTNGRGVDIVVEIAGGSTLEQSIKATRQGGLIPIVGFLGGSKSPDIILPLIFGGKTLYGVFMFTTTMTEALVKFMEEKKIRPAIGGVYGWEDAKSAYISLNKKDAVGKIVIKVGKNFNGSSL